MLHLVASASSPAWFLLLGAWPVFGFFGLDVLLLYWAFRSTIATAYERSLSLRLRSRSARSVIWAAREWSAQSLGAP